MAGQGGLCWSSCCTYLHIHMCKCYVQGVELLLLLLLQIGAKLVVAKVACTGHGGLHFCKYLACLARHSCGQMQQQRMIGQGEVIHWLHNCRLGDGSWDGTLHRIQIPQSQLETAFPSGCKSVWCVYVYLQCAVSFLGGWGGS